MNNDDTTTGTNFEISPLNRPFGQSRERISERVIHGGWEYRVLAGLSKNQRSFVIDIYSHVDLPSEDSPRMRVSCATSPLDVEGEGPFELSGWFRYESDRAQGEIEHPCSTVMNVLSEIFEAVPFHEGSPNPRRPTIHLEGFYGPDGTVERVVNSQDMVRIHGRFYKVIYQGDKLVVNLDYGFSKEA